MKKNLFLTAICLIGIISACTKQEQDLKVSLVGTKWEAVDSWTYGSKAYTDRYVMEFVTETTGTISYFPDIQRKESDETIPMTYIYNYPQVMIKGTRNGETLTENGTISADYNTITADGLTFTRK